MKELSRETAALLRNDKVGFIVFQFTRIVPKTFLRLMVGILRSAFRFGRQRLRQI